MKNSLTPIILVHQTPARYILAKPCLHLVFALLLILAPILLAHGQKVDGPITVSSLSSHATQNGTAVSITADSSLSRAQTWQDKEGFHVVIPDAGLSDLVKSSKGVRVRRVGSAIEILVLTKQGTSVGVQTYDNNLQLTIDGKLDSARSDGDSAVSQDQSSTQSAGGADYSGQSYSNSAASYSTGSSYPAETTSSSAAQHSSGQSAPAQDAPGQVRDAGEYQSQEEGNVVEDETQNQGVLASVFSGTSVLIVLVLAVVALLVIRKFRSKGNVTTKESDERASEESEAVELVDVGPPSVDPRSANGGAMVRANRAVPATGASRERKSVSRPVVNVPASLFGAYRIDQEVGKLVLGQAHRMDVLSSRATDDRRAIEASLIKAIVATDSSDDERRRARQALQEYGFVARQSASLLLAADAFERTSAARSLGEIGSEAALPFLLEALYDVESIVRNQAVVSIGELKVPSAIGALLDMARKHPDVPSSLVSRALSACSVDGLGFFDAVVPATSFLTSGTQDSRGFGITHLEPASCVEELPESIDDEGLTVALAKVGSEDVEERSEAVKCLAQFPVKSSVAALISLTQHDPESTVRSLAVSSLAFIDHESVFPAVLIGMADESREVRAAAARALSRLSFDRADAYTTVIETADDQTLRSVAQACIKAGIVSQNIDRLASGDRRQAYEAFSLICLLAKAQMTDPVLDAIINHSNVNVRVSAVHLLAVTGEEYLFDQLQKLAVMTDIDEEVKTALLEAMYKLEQARPKEEMPVDEFVIRESQEEFETFEKAEESPTFEKEEEFETFETKETPYRSDMGLDFDVGTHVNEVES
jgi:HEAT repeat protein